MTGFIDTHIHAYQLDMIASYGEQLLQWLERYTFPSEVKMKNEIYAAEVAEKFVEQLFRNGTTSAMVFPTSSAKATDLIFEQAAQANMNLITGKVLMDRNAPEELLDTPELSYSESSSLIEKWHHHQRLSYAVTPRFSITSTDEQLKVAGQLFKEHNDLYMQSHLSENVDEVNLIKKLFPECNTYLDTYDQYGLCTDKSFFAHCLHLEPSEISRIKDTGASISCCPTSNLFLGSGIFHWNAMKNAGLSLSLATDVGGGTSFSMLQTTCDLYKISQLIGSPISPMEAFYTITLGNAQSLGLENSIGNLTVGSDADFVIIDPANNPLVERRVSKTESIEEEWFAYMILGDDRLISETWVAGKPVFLNSSIH